MAERLQIEKAYHNNFYDGTEPLDFVDIEIVQNKWLQPCYETGSDCYSDDRQVFHRIIHGDGGWEGKHVLDYACGPGQWSIYFALTGARKVNGFDISGTAIRRGRKRVKAQGLKEKIQLDVMNATKLDYPDNAFDIVVGTGVIHHVIKYTGIFEELFRVMKPGAKAYFLEGLADFPLFRLMWKIKGEVPQGDVPIFSKEIYEKTRMFSDVEIHANHFIYSVKRLLGNNNPGKFRKFILKSCKQLDDILFSFYPPLRNWGSTSYIVLTK